MTPTHECFIPMDKQADIEELRLLFIDDPDIDIVDVDGGVRIRGDIDGICDALSNLFYANQEAFDEAVDRIVPITDQEDFDGT